LSICSMKKPSIYPVIFPATSAIGRSIIAITATTGARRCISTRRNGG